MIYKFHCTLFCCPTCEEIRCIVNCESYLNCLYPSHEHQEPDTGRSYTVRRSSHTPFIHFRQLTSIASISLIPLAPSPAHTHTHTQTHLVWSRLIYLFLTVYTFSQPVSFLYRATACDRQTRPLVVTVY